MTDPANNLVTFGYAGATGLVTSRTDREGGVLRLVLDSLRKVTRTAISANGGVNDSIIVTLAPAESQGLPGTPSVDSAGLFTLYRGPRGIDTTAFFVNPLGAPARIVNAANATTTLTRAGTYSGLVTRVTTVTGQVISATYDTQGRLKTVTDLSTSPSRTTR